MDVLRRNKSHGKLSLLPEGWEYGDKQGYANVGREFRHHST